jgi:alkylation response protein AidB-like acyl-CoA dehydrogenase
MLNSANMSFALCPLLTDGAIEALLTAGSDELKAIYLEKLISGSWTGTMNLTEPQAGSTWPWCAPRRAAARRHLQGVRHQDLHHLR